MRPTLTIALCSALLLLPACKSTSYDFETTSPAEAGKGEIKISLDKTGNGEIAITAEHLAPPQKIDRSLREYVVWAQAGGKDPYKLGVMKYNEKKRTGELTATFSATAFKVIITVEQNPQITAPIGTRVLEVDVKAPAN